MSRSPRRRVRTLRRIPSGPWVDHKMFKYPETCYRMVRLRLAGTFPDRYVAWGRRPSFTEIDGRRWQGAPWQFTTAWRDQYFSVTTMLDDSGALKGHYVNIATPSVLEAGILRYIDLDLDVVVKPDLRFEVVDQEEFRQHARRLGYPADLVEGARRGLERVLQRLSDRRLPFNIGGIWDIERLWR